MRQFHIWINSTILSKFWNRIMSIRETDNNNEGILCCVLSNEKALCDLKKKNKHHPLTENRKHTKSQPFSRNWLIVWIFGWFRLSVDTCELFQIRCIYLDRIFCMDLDMEDENVCWKIQGKMRKKNGCKGTLARKSTSSPRTPLPHPKLHIQFGYIEVKTAATQQNWN